MTGYNLPMLKNPHATDWSVAQIPDAWPDALNLKNPKELLKFFVLLFRNKRLPVKVPEDLPGKHLIPKYILQEFHNLPNGNYSKQITRGYITGFDSLMLGTMGQARRLIAQKLSHLSSVVDMGCGGGQLSDFIKQAGVAKVWGVDPSPYLLQHAARDYPSVNFVQAVAENTDFENSSIDGISACFLLHEVPPKYTKQIFLEANRILNSGGCLAICEPSKIQRQSKLFTLLKNYGWRGVYFGILARRVNEPFVDAWHNCNVAAMLDDCGFDVVSDEDHMPVRHIFAKKRLDNTVAS